MRKLLSFALVAGLASTAFAQARDVNAGPIWNQADADAKCPRVCRPPARWNGQWRTTVQGKMSVCGCIGEPVVIGAPPPRHPVVAPPTVVEPAPVVVAPPPPRPVAPPPAPPPPANAHDVEAGPIWNQADAQQKCPNVCRPPESWNGQWRTTVQGRMSVCGCNYAVAPAIDVVGEYDGQHPDWSDTVRIKRDGRFHRGNGDGGTWSFDGKVLTLAWDHWGPAHLWLKPDGVFFDREQRFRLVRRAAPPPVNRTPPEMAGTYDGTHPHWADVVILTPDGRYHRGNGDPGSWWYDGAALHLKWDRWGENTLVPQPDGSFVDGAFRLARHVDAPPPPPPPPPPPRELRSQNLRLDRPWYRENDQPVVYWEGMPGSNMAWVSIVPRGTADGEWGDWTYTRGASSGSFTATRPLAAGEYEVRAYGDAMSPVMDRLPFRVGRR
jgi:Mannan-binding protein